MATAKDTRSVREAHQGSFGLLANGSSGPWEIAIDESLSGSDRWFAQIEGPVVSFSFEIPSLNVIGKMVDFLSSLMPRNESLSIGKDKKVPIILVKDDEYKDRFFLVVGSMASPMVRFVIAGKDVMNIADALRQVQEDLEED